MGFKMPELIVESVIRDGLKDLRLNSKKLSKVFEIMEAGFANTKYGQAEINKIRKIFETREINVVHAYHQVPENIPCFSILLKDDAEAKNLARLGDFEDDVQETFDDPEDLANLIVNGAVTPAAYDADTGTISIPGTDLTGVHRGLLYVDDQDEEFKIVGIDRTAGSESIRVEPGSDVSIADDGLIKSSINFRQYEQQGITSNESVVIGVHTEEPLLTKYLYIVLKYLLHARKVDLITRGYKNLSYSGSDFSRNLQYNEPVFTRFYTVTGITENDWEGQEVTPIDNVQITTLVPKDKATNAQLGKETQTVQVSDDEDE